MSGAKSRRKGANGEREFAELAREAGFDGAKRTAPMQSGGYADEYGDVSGIPVVRVECKRYRRVPVNRFAHSLPEAPGLVPVLAWRDDGKAWRVDLDAADFLAILRDLEDRRLECNRLRAARRTLPVVEPATEEAL